MRDTSTTKKASNSQTLSGKPNFFRIFIESLLQHEFVGESLKILLESIEQISDLSF
ncbi:MAG: hypothetical protein AAF939_14400 [Planctomycetota bacterium]